MLEFEYHLSGDNRLPLYQQLVDSIKTSMIKQQWRPGDRLLGEKKLAANYKVSVGTLRQAISQLIDENLLERRHGLGTYVRRPTFDNSLFRFFRFETKDGVRQIPESKILSRKVIEASQEVANILNIEPKAYVIFMNRLRLYNGKPMLAEEIWLDYSIFKGFEDMDEKKIGPLLYPIYDTYFGQFVCCAKESLKIEAIDTDYAKMLQIKPNLAVILIERKATGFDGKPIEWRRSRGIADYFNYKIEIH